jgi:hypothetical protein
MITVSIYPMGVSGASIAESVQLVKSTAGHVHHTGKELNMIDQERIVQLKKEIQELKARLPKHSVPAAMIIELEELEEELELLQAQTVHDVN